MANICIPAGKIDAFKKELKQTDLAGLLNKSHSELVEFFGKYMTQAEAETAATLFESKLILKNRLLGIKNLFSKLAKVGKYSPENTEKLAEAQAEFKARQIERILSPKENETFLQGLAEEFVGATISKEQAQELHKLIVISKQALKEFDGTNWSSPEAKANYGASKVLVENFVNELGQKDISLKQMLSERVSNFKETRQTAGTVKAVIDLLLDTLKFISDNSISIAASLDNSFMGRQGLKILMTNPKIWWNEIVKKSFSDIVKVMGNQPARDALWAEIYSNPNYINGNYEKAGIIPEWEEQYPSSLPGRIPFFGRFFKASEQAFIGSALRSRIALFDLYLKTAEKQGVEINDKQIKDIGKIVNGLTARGQWGKKGEPAIVKMFLWAPKMIKANIDVLTMYAGQDITPFARKQAAINLLKIVGTTATLLMMAKAIDEDSVEWDPRSTDFGKIKIGNTRFDITGGAGSLIVLASRLATNSSKSSTTGYVSELGSGFGQQSRFDVIINFLTGKTTPTARVAIDLLRGQDWKGATPTLLGELKSLTVPIVLQNVIELKDDSSADAVLGVLMDAIGINANTYTTTTDWTINAGKAITEFRKKVGEKTFKEANKKYDEMFNDWFRAVKTDVRYQRLTQEQQKQLVSNKKSDLKDKVMLMYGFKYKNKKPTKLPKL